MLLEILAALPLALTFCEISTHDPIKELAVVFF